MKAFVIHLPKIESSLSSAIQVFRKLSEYGFEAHLFEGIYGDEAVELFKLENRKLSDRGIKSQELTPEEFQILYPDVYLPSTVVSISIRGSIEEDTNFKKLLRPGVIGCFYSHYTLWKKCLELNEPIFIFEDDVIFERNYIPVVWDEIILLCTGKEAYKHPYYSKFLYRPEGTPMAIPLRNTSMPGAVGYGITPKGAEKLVREYSVDMLPADTAMNRFVVKLEFHNYLMGRAALEEDGKISLTTTKRWGKYLE